MYNLNAAKLLEEMRALGVDLKCRECGGPVAVDEHLLAIPIWDPKHEKPKVPGQMRVMAQIVCQKCGNVRLWNIGMPSKLG